MTETHTRRSMTDSPSDFRLCTQCGQRRPLDVFRKRGRNSHLRHRECRQCHAANMRFQRSIRKQHDAEAYLSARLDLVRQKRTANERLALIDDLIRRLGGPERVAELFHEQLLRVQREERPGSVLRLLDRFFQLATAVANQPDSTHHNPLHETLGGIA